MAGTIRREKQLIGCLVSALVGAMINGRRRLSTAYRVDEELTVVRRIRGVDIVVAKRG